MIKTLNLSVFIFIFSLIFFLSCGSSPQKYFETTVLNTNMLSGFASDGMSRQLESVSSKLDAGGATVPMKRSEFLDTKTEYIDESLSKIKSLRQTDETKEMINASIALYEFVIPVYKSEYVQLAGLYDNNAPPEQIHSLTSNIHDKYYSKFMELYNKLISIGKIYAEKNNIKVNWAQ